jgi:hypothetical protein
MPKTATRKTPTVDGLRAELERLERQAEATVNRLRDRRNQREREFRNELDAQAAAEPAEPPANAGPNWGDNERRLRWGKAAGLAYQEVNVDMREAQTAYHQERKRLAEQARALCFGSEPPDPDLVHQAELIATKEIAGREMARHRELGDREAMRALAWVCYSRRWDLVAAQAVPLEQLQLLDELESDPNPYGGSRWVL